jgi:type IV pilus assembly protein PilE
MNRNEPRGAAGLTLVELMIVVAVMSIIAAVAYPLYTTQMQKIRRADAKAALAEIALAQERFYTVNGRYEDNLSSLSLAADLADGDTEQGYYSLAITHPSGDTQRYQITATRVSTGPQADDACGNLSLDSLGVKSKSGAGTNCW